MSAEQKTLIQPDCNVSLNDIIKREKKENNGSKYNRLTGRKRYNKKRNIDNRKRVRVEKLGKDLQNPDLIKLFEKYGNLTRCGIKFDKLGNSTGKADVQFSTHEECENAINKLDHAEINGEEIRVKYAPNPGRSRRTRSSGYQRRFLRRENRSKRSLSTRNRRRIGTRGTRTGTNSKKNLDRSKRRYFARTIGRSRRKVKRQD